MADFPSHWATYAAARKLLVDSGKIVFNTRSLRAIIINDFVKAAEIEAMSMEERRTAFDLSISFTALKLLSARGRLFLKRWPLMP